MKAQLRTMRSTMERCAAVQGVAALSASGRPQRRYRGRQSSSFPHTISGHGAAPPRRRRQRRRLTALQAGVRRERQALQGSLLCNPLGNTAPHPLRNTAQHRTDTEARQRSSLVSLFFVFVGNKASTRGFSKHNSRDTQITCRSTAHRFPSRRVAERSVTLPPQFFGFCRPQSAPFRARFLARTSCPDPCPDPVGWEAGATILVVLLPFCGHRVNAIFLQTTNHPPSGPDPLPDFLPVFPA